MLLILQPTNYHFLWRLSNRAGSVLTETEEPAVLEQFFKTETEIEPIYEETLEPLKNRNRISEPRVPEFNQFHGKIDEI